MEVFGYLLGCALSPMISADAERPNIVTIREDDAGHAKLSACTGVLMGCEILSIDRVTCEGMMFPGSYAEHRCTV